MGKFRAITYVCVKCNSAQRLFEKKPCFKCGGELKRYRRSDFDPTAKALRELNKMAKEMLS